MYLERGSSTRWSTGVEPTKTESVGQKTCLWSKPSSAWSRSTNITFTHGTSRYRRHFYSVSSGPEVLQTNGQGLLRKTPHGEERRTRHLDLATSMPMCLLQEQLSSDSRDT
jgi:hypothetical protein